MTMIVELGATRTGQFLHELKVELATNAKKDIHGEDAGEFIIPLSEISDGNKAKLERFLKTSDRFMTIKDPTNTTNPILFSGPIENFSPSKDDDSVSTACIGIGTWLRNVPALPSAKRGRIDSTKDVWTLTGTASQIISTLLQESLKEEGNYRFPRTIVSPTIVTTGQIITHVVQLSEVPSVKDVLDELRESYSGFETVFVPRQDSNKTTYWDVKVGEPHVNKNLAPLDINIDQQGNGVTSFSYTHNGQDKANWSFVRSDTVDEKVDGWIDLKSVVIPPSSGDDEYLSVYNKEFFNVPLSTTQLEAQGEALINNSSLELKTFSIKVFDESFNIVHQVGRRLRVMASKSLVGLDEMMRITNVEFSLDDPTSISITVMPANLRVYPKLPDRFSDVIKDTNKKKTKTDKWKKKPKDPELPPKPPETDPTDPTDPPVIIPPTVDPNDDWDKPGKVGTFPPKGTVQVVKSPITDIYYYNSETDYYSDIYNEYGRKSRVSESIWGERFSWKEAGGWENRGPDGFTVIPNQSRGNFYGLSWLAQVLKCDEETRVDPVGLEILQSRKFNSFPTAKYTEVGNPPIWDDENMGFSGKGGVVGKITSLEIKGKIMGDDGPGILKYERLANGHFFLNSGENQKIVIYIHQLQVYDNGATHIRSRGVAWEGKINNETGELLGGWTVTPYPFEVAASDRTYYPMTSQVETHGTNLDRVSCITPASYLRSSDLPTSFPAIVNNTYWEKVGMGRYATDDCTITKNYKTGKTFQTTGANLGVFQSENWLGGGVEGEEGERWTEAYELFAYNNELYAQNMSYTGYYTREDDGSQWPSSLYLSAFIKAKTDSTGKPGAWETKSMQYGFARWRNYRYPEGVAIVNRELIRVGEYIFTGAFSYDGVPEGMATTATIAAKVGAESLRIMYGNLPTASVNTFSISNNASGYTEGPKEFFPDFWDFKLSSQGTPSRGGGSTWWRNDETGVVLPIWNGTADNNQSNETIHGGSTLKGLNVGNMTVTPASTASLLGYGGSTSSQWRWYKI